MKDIKERFIISIVDNNGIRQFSVHKFIKKLLVYILLFAVILAVLVFFAIRILSNELSETLVQKNMMLEKYANIYIKSEQLKQQIEISQNKLDEINQAMLELEDVMTMKKNNVAKKNVAKFDLSTLNESKKSTILSLLPNAKPFAADAEAQDSPHSSPNFSQNASQNSSGVIFRFAKSTPIIATADGIVDVTSEKNSAGIGSFVKVVHSFGFTSIYGHLAKISVKRGDVIKRGQVLGFSSVDSSAAGGSNTAAGAAGGVANSAVANASNYSNGRAFRAFYDIRFLGSEVEIGDFLAWDADNFNAIINKNDSIVDWNSLLWAFDDMMKINNHKFLTNHENLLGSRSNARPSSPANLHSSPRANLGSDSRADSRSDSQSNLHSSLPANLMNLINIANPANPAPQNPAPREDLQDSRAF